MAERIDTVVIGAGQAGLAASYGLTTRRQEHVVLERGRVGETWRSQRWDGFHLNTPNWATQLPGFQYRGPGPDAFASLQEVIQYFEAYARGFGAPLREGIEVIRVFRKPGAFRVATLTGEIEARQVVVAAGAYQKPAFSALWKALSPGITRIHTSEYRRPSQLPPGAVLIIGSGQSGCQIAEELLAAGRRVYLSVGRCPWVPRRYRGRDFMKWTVDLGLADQTVDTLPSPEARLRCNFPVSGNDGGHDCNPRWLARRGAVLLGRVEAIEGSRLVIGSGLEECLRTGDAFVAEFKQRVDAYVAASGMSTANPEPEEEPTSIDSVSSLDLRHAGIATVIGANGFRPDHSWIEGVETDAQGFPIQQRGVSSVPGLYFVGLHWLRKRKSALLLGVGEDADYVAARVAEHSAPRAMGGT